MFTKSRITPAYAGNTHLRNNLNRGYRGSPPPTRGTQLATQKFIKAYGITPAYAGNTSCLHSVTVKYEDHPRLRGEHLLQRPNRLQCQGSPPPTRGTHDVNSLYPYVMGITPAYAGNTSQCISVDSAL